MHPFFIAHGPAFKQGYVSEPFSSVNVYELVCHLAGVSINYCSDKALNESLRAFVDATHENAFFVWVDKN